MPEWTDIRIFIGFQDSISGLMKNSILTSLPCGTDFSGLSTYRLTAKVREMSTPPMPIRAWSPLPLPFYLYLYLLWWLQVLGAESREQLRAVVALYTTVSISIIQRRHNCTEEVVSVLVHSLKSGLASRCIDLKAASYMILSQLCVTVTLNASVVSRLVSRLAKVRIRYYQILSGFTEIHRFVLRICCMCTSILFWEFGAT